MKNIDDILAQFDQVPEPAVVAETLGAYIEGNLSPEESLEVEMLMDESPEMGYLMTAATDPEPEIIDDLDLDDLPELPTVPGLSDADMADDLEVEVVDEAEVAEVVADDDLVAVESDDLAEVEADGDDLAAVEPDTDPVLDHLAANDQPIDAADDFAADDFIDLA